MCGGSEEGGRRGRGGWDHFVEKVCHEGGGNPKGLKVGWAWVMEWYSGKIELLEQTKFNIMRNLDMLASFDGFVVAGMESVCGDMDVK